MNDEAIEKESKQLSFKISGMNCPVCADRIKNALLREVGVNDAEVSLQKAEAVVEIEDDIIDRDLLVDAIESLGYIVVI
ncbi:MAG: heavy-metal-associated domain-containing protein [Candidatus Thorarchaeota archaeon]